MTEESAKHRLGNRRQTYGSTRRNRLGVGKETASGSLHGRSRRGCRLARHHRATMFSAAPAAGRKAGVLSRSEHRRTDQRKAEERHQQYREPSTHPCTILQTVLRVQPGTFQPERFNNPSMVLRDRICASANKASAGRANFPVVIATARSPCEGKTRGDSPPPGRRKCGKKARNYLQSKDETKIAPGAFNTTK